MTFILDTRGYDQPVDTIIEKVKDTLESLGSTIRETANLGQRDFARVLDKKMPNAIYVQFLVDAPTDMPSTIGEKLRLDKTIYRILTERM